MAEIDVVARLQLRAEQFSSETAKQFAEMRGRAETAAQSVRTSFVTSFGEVQKLAQNALTLPRTTTGSLDLSSEITQLRQSAIASEEKATALRELSFAAMAAAGSERTVTEATRLEADAARIAAEASERDAGATRQRILALEEIQRELNKTASATGLSTRAIEANQGAGARAGISAGQQRNAMQQLGFQLNDVSTQWASGTKASVIFAQQSGQVIQALSLMTTGAKGVLGFLGGPWGIVLTAAATVLIPMVAKLAEGNHELDDQIKKLKDHAAQERLSAQANAIWANSLDGMIENTRKLTDEMDRQLRTQDQIDAKRSAGAQQASRGAQTELNRADVDRRAAQQALDAAVKAKRDNDEPRRIGVLSQAVVKAQGQLDQATERFRKAVGLVISTQNAVRATDIPIIERGVASSLDASTAATNEYTAALGKLREERERGAISADKFEQELKRITTLRDRAIKSAQDAKKAANDNGGRDPDTLTSTAVAKLLRDALPGVRVTSTTRTAQHNAEVGGAPNSYHVRGNAVDFVPAGGMKSMTKEDVKRLFTSRGIDVLEVFGPGDAGHSDHFHVAWTKGKNALDEFADAAKRAKVEAKELAEVGAAVAKMAGKGFDAIQYMEDQRAADDAASKRFRTIMGDSELDDFQRGLDRADTNTQDTVGGQTEANERERQRQEQMIRSTADLFGDLFIGQTDNIWNNFERYGQQALSDLAAKELPKLLAKLPAGLKGILKGGLEEGGAYGQLGGSVFSSITGGKNNAAASTVGGVLGDVAGKALAPAIAKTIGGTLGKTLGGAAGPIGSIVGGILGNVVGGLFQKTPKGSAGISTAGGQIKATSASGTTAEARAGASSLAGAVSNGLQRIADMLGAQITGNSDVQIGTYKGELRVNDHGGAIGGVKGSGAISFTSEQDAISYAIADALKDGVLTGISEAARRIIASGQDLDKAITKALAIETIPKQLKAMLDPVGAALDELNTKWKTTVDALKEGGATAEQFAQAEQLYKLQLDQVKASTVSASQSLKDFLTTLKVGGDSPLSLRDQEVTATANLQPFLDKIAAGSAIDQEKFQAAAKAELDVYRSLYGSTQPFFDKFEQIQDATNKAIASIDNAVPITKAVESPFAKATADGVQVGNEIAAQNSDYLARIAASLDRLGGGGGGVGGDGDFIGSLRNFAGAY